MRALVTGAAGFVGAHLLRLMRERGLAFRDAYREIGTHLERLKSPDHDAVVRARTHLGSTGNLGLKALIERLASAQREWAERKDALEAVWNRLLEGGGK